MHLIEHLQVDAAFDGGLAAPEAEARLAAFAQGEALRIIDDLFDAACGPDEVWHIDELALDLGEVPADRMEETWAQRLRERLQERLSDLRGPAGMAAAQRRAGAVQRTRPQARLEALLHYLRHGHMPWQAHGEDPQRLGAEVLQHSATALAAALRALDDRPRLLRRLAAQFDAAWLAALVQALMPGEPAAAARLLQAGALASGTGRGSENGALLWQAVLEQALAHAGSPHAVSVALLRAQLRVALDAGDVTPHASDPLLALASAWAPLLRSDRTWLQGTLQRLGDSAAVRRRIARAVPEALLAQLMALWLGTDEAVAAQDLGGAADAGAAAAADEGAAPHDEGAPDRLDTLLHYLLHGHMPWDARGADVQRLAAEVLEQDAPALAAALRTMGDRPRLLRRLVAQFDAASLAALVQALLPGEPAAARRLLEAAAPATRAGRGNAGAALLWEAVLGEALDHAGTPQRFGQALLRAQLRLALDAGDVTPHASDPLLALAAVWAPLLQDDRAWLRTTLQRLGDGVAVRQRLLRALPGAVAAQAMALWRGDGPADTAPAHAAGRAGGQGPAGLPALLHYLRHGHLPVPASEDAQQLATALLRDDGPALAAALRALDARPRLLDRLATQFHADWLAGLVHALMPGEPAAAARLLQATVHAATVPAGSALLAWQAVLGQAMAHPALPARGGPAMPAAGSAAASLVLPDAAASRHGSDTADTAETADTADALAPLLHYLRHGHLSDRAGPDAQQLAATALRRSPIALAAALRAMDDRPRLVRRLATQFDAAWLGALVQALMPGQPTAVARLLQVATPAAGASPGTARAALLWEAVLAHALASSAAQPGTGVALLRLQLQAALEAGVATAQANDPLLALAPAWEPLLQADGAWLKATLQRQAAPAAVRQRLVRAMPEALLPQVLALWWGHALTGAVQNWIASVAAGTQAAAAELACRRQLLWQATLQHAQQGSAALFDAAAYAEDVRTQIVAVPAQSTPRWFDRAVQAATAVLAAAAAALGWTARARRAPAAPSAPLVPAAALSPPGLPAPAFEFPPPELPETLPVGNAGLVLVASYMPRLFAMLGLADERAFVDAAAALRGVQLLQLLVTGEPDAPEPALVLNKLLCGVEQATPVARVFEASAAERDAIEGLLGAVVQHWKVLGTTSVAGLRETFLRREGRLQHQDDAWQLQVVPGPFDMLIDQLPWGYATIRHPWMKQVLHVEWR